MHYNTQNTLNTAYGHTKTPRTPKWSHNNTQTIQNILASTQQHFKPLKTL